LLLKCTSSAFRGSNRRSSQRMIIGDEDITQEWGDHQQNNDEARDMMTRDAQCI
jgi:hypothetical protein